MGSAIALNDLLKLLLDALCRTCLQTYGQSMEILPAVFVGTHILGNVPEAKHALKAHPRQFNFLGLHSALIPLAFRSDWSLKVVATTHDPATSRRRIPCQAGPVDELGRLWAQNRGLSTVMFCTSTN